MNAAHSTMSATENLAVYALRFAVGVRVPFLPAPQIM
jgi:hypothetical protein